MPSETTIADQRDPRVEAAISHWGPRFVANGVPFSDFHEVAGSVTRWEDWCSAWSARGDIHRALGEEAMEADFRLSAGGHFTRAAVCYHFGKFLFVNDLEQMKAAHRKAIDCRNRALPLLDPPGERIAIPYAGKTLYGNLRRPRGPGKAPVVIMCMGLDSTKEEMDDYENRFLARGLATLAFDGPGQGEGEYDFPLCPEYERPVKAVVDLIETRRDVDTSRIGIWGVSLGGYLAPRAAAHEPRIKACVALSGAFQRRSTFEGRPSINVEAFRVRSGSATVEEAGRVSARMSLADCAHNIKCPIYIVAGTKDRLTGVDQAETLAQRVKGPVVLSIIEGGNHVVNNYWYRYRDQTADWMARQLGANSG